MVLFVGWLTLAAVAAAAILLLAGESLFGLLPPVRRFARAAAYLQSLQISGNRIGVPISISAASSLPLFKIAATGTEVSDHWRARPLGDAVGLVHVSARRHRVVIKELKGYCIFLLGLFGIALAHAANASDYKLTFMFLVQEVGKRPFEFAGMLELVMISFFIVRLCLELIELGEIVD